MRFLCPTIVGRLSELDVLGTLLPTAAAGAGNTVFLIGEAGLGKSRLTREAHRVAAGLGMLVLRGRAAPSVHYRPLTEALLGILRQAGDPASGLADSAELAPYRAALTRLIPGWGPAGVTGADDHPIVLAEAVLRLLRALARTAGPAYGCLLILEDLHDADAETLMIVDYLADNIGGEPILLLATMRPGHDATPMAYAAEQRHSAVVQPMGPLDARGVREMTAACLDLPPAEVPAGVLDRVVRSSSGIPFFVEELLTGMLDEGTLVRDGERWSTAAGPGEAQVPAAVRAGVVARTRRLGPGGQRLLLMAAVLEQPCPGPVLGAAAGLDPAALVTGLRAAVDAQLLVVDGTGRYSVQHALVGEALRAATLPEVLAALAGAAATAIEEAFAGLPDEWGVLAGRLWQQAGNTGRAAELFYLAGRRAAGQGAVRTAITLLERALALLADGTAEPGPTARTVEALLEMLVAAGEVSRAREFTTLLDRHGTAEERAAVHLRLARAAITAGQWDVGRREFRKVGTPPGSTALAASTDVVAARLAVADSDPQRLQRAEHLATRALRTVGTLRAEGSSAGLPEIACEALAVLGVCARVDDLDRSDEFFGRALTLAEENGLTLWRIRFLFQLGAHAAIREADPRGLIDARAAAERAGAIITALDGQAELAVLHLTRGEYETAGAHARECEEAAHRLGLGELRLIALGLRICVAAHRGHRAQVSELREHYDRLGGRRCDFTPALKGFGLALCSLLEEDRPRAWAEVTEAVAEEAHRPPEYLSLAHGLHLAMTVLTGDAGWPDYDRLALSARGQAGWNRLFLLVAGAVLAGRAGDAERAGQLMAEFDQVATPYPLGRHLGLRLAAEAAVTEGWGSPGPWLRTAEQHFHWAGNLRVADACRALLRQAGETAPQRRHGAESIPPSLRRVGVTVREYEVLELLVERLTNPEIGRRLFVSPRTVETHVTRLLAKTGMSDRAALARHAKAQSTANRSAQ